MSITKSVNKTEVNGDEKFVYNIEFSFSDLTETNQIGEIKDFHSSNILISEPITGSSEVVKYVTYEEVDGGTMATYNLGTVSAGTTGSFNYFAQFGPGRKDQDTFTNTAYLYSNSQQLEESTAETVTLTLDENFRLTKDIVYKDSYKAGDELEVKLYLQNTNDRGAQIQNVIIQDILPSGLTAVTDFTPIGEDVEINGYNDSSVVGIGSWEDNVLTFEIPSYSGTRYVITFKVTIDEDVEDGQIITNTATWTKDGVAGNNASDTITIFIDKVTANFYKNGPLYALIGDTIMYNMGIRNTGTVDLTGVVWEDIVPDEVNLKSFSLYTQKTRIEQYSVYIVTSEDETEEVPVLLNIAGTSTINFNLETFTADGTKIKKFIIKADKILANSSNSTLYLFGEVNDTAIDEIVNTTSYTANSSIEAIEGEASATTLIQDTSYLEINKNVSKRDLLIPLEEIDVLLSARARNSSIINPIFIDYLPEGLEYFVGSAIFEYRDLKENRTYYSNRDDFPDYIPIPETEVIKNEEDDRTFLRWQFDDFTIPYLYTLSVRFTAIVAIDPPTDMENIAYLGNIGSNTFLNSWSEYVDIDDYDGDSITNETIAKSNIVYLTALNSSIFKVEKYVQGELDTEFSLEGYSTAGGTAQYKLYVTNSFTTDITNIELVDILPHKEDTGVILVDEVRGSVFRVYPSSIVSAEIINIIGEDVEPDQEIIIEYSQSNDPVRFGADNTLIGTDDDWSITPPSSITSVHAFKVSTGEGVILKTYDRLVVTINVILAETPAIGSKAYNSFAVKGSRILDTGEVLDLIPTEPNKVSLEVVADELSKIGNLTWIDANDDGYYEEGEEGLNGVVVELYDENKDLLQSTITMQDPLTLTDGYYMFEDLEKGNYYVRFVAPEDYMLTIQRTDSRGGSVPNREDGFTDLIELPMSTNLLDIDAGFVCAGLPTINAENKCIYQDEEFSPTKGIKVTNCDGSQYQISEKAIISNDVDITTPGVYYITYTFTSTVNGLENTKTIEITVVETEPHHQAITDLVESVALEQTAISHIINAEGEKIQKALELEVTNEELLEVNDSVSRMLKSLTRLELALQTKLSMVPIKGIECPYND
ncbi:MAG: SdrD B-like domain-containing protein [bacterium]